MYMYTHAQRLGSYDFNFLGFPGVTIDKRQVSCLVGVLKSVRNV